MESWFPVISVCLPAHGRTDGGVGQSRTLWPRSSVVPDRIIGVFASIYSLSDGRSFWRHLLFASLISRRAGHLSCQGMAKRACPHGSDESPRLDEKPTAASSRRQTFHLVSTGEHLVILGPNGAGKTTLFNLLTGQVKSTSGQIFFQGEDITNLPAHRRIHLGIGRSFQITSLFNGLNVLDNMLLAVQGTKAERYQMVHPLKRNRQLMDKAGELLDSFDLLELKNELVSSISYGAQRKLEIALSMASDPSCFCSTNEQRADGGGKRGAVHRISNLGKHLSASLMIWTGSHCDTHSPASLW
jgi:ABC-type lipopolysaccharide export system ATPase subunit